MIGSFEKKPENGGMPTSDECADQEDGVRLRHQLSEAAHLADVLLARERVDDDAGREEEQRLEEGVRHQVEHRVWHKHRCPAPRNM